ARPRNRIWGAETPRPADQTRLPSGFKHVPRKPGLRLNSSPILAEIEGPGADIAFRPVAPYFARSPGFYPAPAWTTAPPSPPQTSTLKPTANSDPTPCHSP